MIQVATINISVEDESAVEAAQAMADDLATLISDHTPYYAETEMDQ